MPVCPLYCRRGAYYSCKIIRIDWGRYEAIKLVSNCLENVLIGIRKCKYFETLNYFVLPMVHFSCNNFCILLPHLQEYNCGLRSAFALTPPANVREAVNDDQHHYY